MDSTNRPRRASSGRRKPLVAVAVWRDAIRDSGLDRTARLVAFVLSTYMTADGETGHDRQHPSPSKTTLARGAGLSSAYKGSTAVSAAIDRLQAAGYLEVERRRGWQGYRYRASIPRLDEGLLTEAIPRGDEGFTGSQSLAERSFNPSRGRGSIPRRGVRESAKSDKSVRGGDTMPALTGGVDEEATFDAATFLEQLG